MPLTLGKLGFGYENGIEKTSSHKFEKLSTEKLLKRIKSDHTNDSSEDGKFSIQYTSHLSLMNCFDLLQDLTNYSHELFSDLTYLVKSTNQKISNLSAKIKTLQETPIETQIKQANFTLIVPSENTNPNDENPPYQTFQSAPYHFTISLIDRNQLSLSLIRNLSKLQKNPNFEVFHSYPSEFFSKSSSQRVRSIGEVYSSPEYFLDQWLLQQERRLEEMETVKKQAKLDRKKRDKVKQKATQGQRRKSAGDGIQIVRWQDRYSGDGRTIASGKSKTSKTSHSYFGNRSNSQKSLNFDDFDDDSTIATTTTAKPYPDDESVSSSIKKKPSQEIDGPQTKDRSLSIASSIMSEDDIPPRPSVAGLFPKVDDSKQASKDIDDDDDDDDDDEAQSNNLNLSALSNDSDVTKPEDKVSGGAEEAEPAPKPRPKSVRIVLREDEVIPRLEVLSKNVVVNLEDPSVFISPIPFLVMDDESVTSSRPTSKRISVELRYSNVYEERVVSANVNPEKIGSVTPIAERNKEESPDKVKITPSPPPGALRPPRPPVPPKRESLGGDSPNPPAPVEPPKERKVGFAAVPAPPPKITTKDLPAANDEDQVLSPSSRSDRRILAKSVRLGQNFADILAAAPKAKPPPPPPPAAPKFTRPDNIPPPPKPPAPPAPPVTDTSVSNNKSDNQQQQQQTPPSPASAPIRPPPPPASALHRPPPPPVQVGNNSSPSVSATSSPMSPPPMPRPSLGAGFTPSPTNSEGGSKPVSLMDAIRRGSTLKKVSEEETVAAKKAAATSATSLGAFGSSAVTAILERRKFVVESDSESDSDKEDWD